jgi:hypothetical protein
VGNKNSKYWCHTSGYMTNYEIPHEEGWSKGTNCKSRSFRPYFHLLENSNTIADCLGIQFTLHDLCDENHKRQVEARVQTLFKAVDNNSPEKIWLCDLQKLVNSLKLWKACGIDGIPNECLRQLPRRPLVHLTWLTRDRPNLSSDRAPHRNNTATFRQKIISGHKWTWHQNWPTVSRNMTLPLTLVWGL